MTDKLEPPPEHRHHRWHWIETEHGPMCASWFPEISGIRSAWDISGHNKFSDDPLVLRMWRYIGPAIPPHEERQDLKGADEARAKITRLADHANPLIEALESIIRRRLAELHAWKKKGS